MKYVINITTLPDRTKMVLYKDVAQSYMDVSTRPEKINALRPLNDFCASSYKIDGFYIFLLINALWFVIDESGLNDNPRPIFVGDFFECITGLNE